MTTKKTEYGCEVCGAYYDTDPDAADCEKSHPVAVAVKAVQYDITRSKHPSVVEVTFSDGAVGTYSLPHVGWIKTARTPK